MTKIVVMEVEELTEIVTDALMQALQGRPLAVIEQAHWTPSLTRT